MTGRTLRKRSLPVNYKYLSWEPGSADGSNEEQDTVMHDDSSDDDSEGSVYDAQEEQNEAEDEKNDGGSDYDAAEELKNRANGSGEDNLMSDSDSKSRRKGRSLSKRKRETWQEVPALLKRAAAIQKLPNVNAALEEQRALLPTDFQISVPPYATFPHLQSTQDFIDWGSEIMGQVRRMESIRYTGEDNLHPIMSMLYSPYEKRPKFEDQYDANGPVRSPWRKAEPTKVEEKEWTKSKGSDRTAQEVREEQLNPDKYNTKRLIPWLPDVIPLNAASWKLALYTALGATPDDIAHRVAMNDAGLNERLVCHKQLRNRLKKKIDDWLKAHHGGFQWLEDRQKSRARTGASQGQEQKHEFASAILIGMENSQLKRKAVSDLGYYFNTTWDVDIKLRVMKQPGGLGAPHPLWEPRERREIPQAIQEWRKNVAKLPNLPELEDLLKDDEEGVEDLLEEHDDQAEDMSGLEAG